MRAITIFILFFTLIIPSIFNAKIHEKPNIPAFAKVASDIVVATEGDTIDGQLTVLESLKGELKPGDNLTIPEFVGFSSEEARAIDDLGLLVHADNAPQERKYVTCSRMILFLQRNPATVEGTDRVITGELPLWAGIGDLSIYQSTIWVEGGRTYGFYDVNSFNGHTNDERGILADLELSEGEIRKEIDSKRSK